MSEGFKTFWLGLFLIAFIAIMTWFLLFLRPTVGDGKQTLRVRFSNIEKIATGTRVTFAGRPVGEVEEINEIPHARSGPTDANGNIYFYELVLKIDSHVKVCNTDEIMFSTAGLLGEKTVAIVPKKPKEGQTVCGIKNEVIYGQSSSRLDDALDELKNVSQSVDKTMCQLSDFMDKNSEDFHLALRSFTTTFNKFNENNTAAAIASAMNRIDAFGKMALDQALIQNISQAMLNLSLFAGQINSGQGSLGKIVYDDCFYYKINDTLCRFETLLNDISNYGLLFQYDKAWQREKRRRLSGAR